MNQKQNGQKKICVLTIFSASNLFMVGKFSEEITTGVFGLKKPLKSVRRLCQFELFSVRKKKSRGKTTRPMLIENIW